MESPVESKRVVRLLPVKLSDAELIEFGKRLAQTSTDIHNEEERQTQVKAELKAKIGSFETERTRLASVVSSGRENRDVSCDMVFDYSRLIVEVVRLDTKEVVETRRMTEAEQQRNLFREEKEQAGGQEATPEQVEEIRQHLQAGRQAEKVAEVIAAIAQTCDLFLSPDDITAMSSADFAILEKVAQGIAVAADDVTEAGASLGQILDRAHIAGERDGAEQHCTQCGARLDFMAAGLPEGFPPTTAVGQSCDVRTQPANGQM